MNLYDYGTPYYTPDIDPYSLSVNGGGLPKEKRFFQAAQYSYDKHAPKYLSPVNDNFRLIIDTPTVDAYLNTIDNSILIGIRGTDVKSFNDLKADAKLLTNRLTTSNRYIQDKGVIQAIIARFPPEKHEYYISGHSLGAAIMSQLKRDFPFFIYGVGYNGAYQPIDFLNHTSDIKRIYTDKDFLYKLGGYKFRDNTVIPTPIQEPPSGFMGMIKNKLTPTPIQSHSVDLFEDMYEGQGQQTSQVQRINIPAPAPAPDQDEIEIDLSTLVDFEEFTKENMPKFIEEITRIDNQVRPFINEIDRFRTEQLQMADLEDYNNYRNAVNISYRELNEVRKDIKRLSQMFTPFIENEIPYNDIIDTNRIITNIRRQINTANNKINILNTKFDRARAELDDQGIYFIAENTDEDEDEDEDEE